MVYLRILGRKSSLKYVSNEITTIVLFFISESNQYLIFCLFDFLYWLNLIFENIYRIESLLTQIHNSDFWRELHIRIPLSTCIVWEHYIWILGSNVFLLRVHWLDEVSVECSPRIRMNCNKLYIINYLDSCIFQSNLVYL